MKKIILMIVSLCAVITLSSCEKTSETYNQFDSAYHEYDFTHKGESTHVIEDFGNYDKGYSIKIKSIDCDFKNNTAIITSVNVSTGEIYEFKAETNWVLEDSVSMYLTGLDFGYKGNPQEFVYQYKFDFYDYDAGVHFFGDGSQVAFGKPLLTGLCMEKEEFLGDRNRIMFLGTGRVLFDSSQGNVDNYNVYISMSTTE